MSIKYRVCFSPNTLYPFIYPKSSSISLSTAAKLLDYIADFDLGRIRIDDQPQPYVGALRQYQSYRRGHSINHPDLISCSVGWIERFVDGQWEDVDESEYDKDAMAAMEEELKNESNK